MSGRHEPREAPANPAAPGPRQVLIVLRERDFTTFPLPASGSVTIGRGDDCDVRIEDASISRRHARLHLGPPLAIEDLGSANGVRIQDAKQRGASSSEQTARTRDDERRIAARRPIEIAPGRMIRLGNVVLVVQRATVAERPRRFWPHGYFEARLEEECNQPAAARGPFALLRIHVGSSLPAADVEAVLSSTTRPTDVLATYGPHEYELLLLDADAATARAIKDRIAAELADRGGRVSTGMVMYPDDGSNPEALIAAACARVRAPSGAAEEGPIVVVRDPVMIQLHRLVERVADSAINVLLLGETGVGKEIFAEAIWRQSSRASRPMLRLSCAAISETLLESELFGHERGAFTGAVQPKVGLLESADGGVVFLDEIGELPVSVQVKLLRVIEDRRVTRVGAVKPRRVDVRFIAATNRDLEREVAEGRFRGDLFYRVNGISLAVPPLRERISEIEPLARAFLAHFAAQATRPCPKLTSQAAALLEQYSWPGNVRELRNVMERALLLCEGAPIRVEHLPMEKFGGALDPATPAPAASVETSPTGGVTPRDRERILAALAQCAGNQTRAAKLLGISRGTLVARLKQFRIPRPRT